MAALFVIQFLYGWNQYLWPLLVTTRDDMQTVVIGLRKMTSITDQLTEWQIVMATAVLAMLPPVVVCSRCRSCSCAAWWRPRSDLLPYDRTPLMAGLALDTLRKTYSGGVDAVRGVSLDVPDGAFCVLVGPSGCGKSTVLRMIAGLETVTSGAITIGGRTVNDVEPADRDIAMVFQNYALYPHMRVYDNLAYGLRNRGTPKSEIETR